MSETVTERPSSSSSSSSSAAGKVREIDPLLKDLSEKKQSFRRNVVSLAAELKDVRGRLASQEQSFVRETLTRQACRTAICIISGNGNILFFFLANFWVYL